MYILRGWVLSLKGVVRVDCFDERCEAENVQVHSHRVHSCGGTSLDVIFAMENSWMSVKECQRECRKRNGCQGVNYSKSLRFDVKNETKAKDLTPPSTKRLRKDRGDLVSGLWKSGV